MKPLPFNVAAAREALVSIAAAASAVLRGGYRSDDLGLEHKGAIDLVTRFDRESESVIRARVERAFGDTVDLVAEEAGGEVSGARPVLWADPLDGTTNFAHGHPFFAVSLGLAVGDTLVAAAVDAPALGLTWSAALGHGATRNGGPCRVSRTGALDQALLATGFPYDNRTNPEHNFREFAGLTRRSRGVRRCGSAALDLCLVADGTFDGYWERHLKPWDLAAGALLVAEAGGRVTALDGGPLRILDGALCATNGPLHPHLLAAIDEARREAL